MKRFTSFFIIGSLLWVNVATAGIPAHLKQSYLHSTFGKKMGSQIQQYRHCEDAFDPITDVSGDCDTIVLKDGRLAAVNIQRVTSEGVFYQKCGVEDGKEYLMESTNIELIRYRNGKTEVPPKDFYDNFTLPENVFKESKPEPEKPAVTEKKLKRNANILLWFAAATILVGAMAIWTIIELADALILWIPLTLILGLFTLVGGFVIFRNGKRIADHRLKKQIRRKAIMAILSLLLIPLALTFIIVFTDGL